MNYPDLAQLLKHAWTKETSSDPVHWTPENPAWGQCAVTALVVHDYFGGKLLWTSARTPDGQEISHYFNETAQKEIIDLTRHQFPQGTIIPEGKDKTKEFSTTRDYVLSYSLTAQRYTTLKENLQRLTKSTQA